MIKFFRKIRRNLLSENKFSKYLLYAIGEIALVIIGIILALQINNWNQNTQNQNRLKSYLKLLIQDLEKDEIILKQCLLFDEEKENYIRRTMAIAPEDTIRGFTKGFITLSLTIHDATYKSMSSGNILELIKSPEIQNSISAYYSNIESVKRFENRYLNATYNSLINEFFTIDNISDYMKNPHPQSIESIPAAIVSNKLRAHLLHTANVSRLEQEYYRDLLDEIDVLTKLLNSELDNK